MVWVPNTYLQCYVQNIAAIEWAPPGTQWNSDPTDDISTATALVPSPNCPPPTGPTNLTITKTADPAGCFLLGGDVVCQFALTVTNSGPNLYSDAIQVYDEPMPGTIAEFGPAPWSCAVSGAGFDCSHPATLLFPNQQLHLWSWVRMPVDEAQFEGCQITNEAWITSAPGGTQPNLDPADDSASATAFAPGDICVAAANQEKVECPAGFAVKDGACQPVVQPLPIVTPPPKIVCPRNMEKVRRSEVSRLRSEGWKLIRLKGGQWCGRPGVRPPPVDPCPHTMDRVPASQVAQLRREGWDVSRVQGTNIWCGRPGRPVDPCYDGERLITSKRQADNLRGRGATVRRVRWNGQRAWCTGPVPPLIIIDPPICIGGNLSKAGRGWICICPRGYLRDRRVTNAGRLRFRCTPGPDPRRCNRNEQTVTSLVQVQLLKAKRYRVRKIGTRLWCARPPIQSNQCRHGERTVRSANVLATLRPRARTIRKIGKKHWCVTLWPRCKIGHVRKNGKCVPIIKKCPKGMVGVWPKCIPKKCPRGTTGKFPLCKPIIKKCPKGTIGIWPRCIKKKCPPGTKGKFPLCKPIIKKCPKGTIGIYPRCIKKKCPPGTKGKFPLCKPIIKCPKGTVGKFPKCRKIGGKPKPPKCPVGYKGRPPNCKPLVKLPKFKCPKGTVGKWPKCKRVD